MKTTPLPLIRPHPPCPQPLVECPAFFLVDLSKAESVLNAPQTVLAARGSLHSSPLFSTSLPHTPSPVPMLFSHFELVVNNLCHPFLFKPFPTTSSSSISSSIKSSLRSHAFFVVSSRKLYHRIRVIESFRMDPILIGFGSVVVEKVAF